METGEKNKSRKTPMWRKLFFYMSTLALIVSASLLSGIFLLGNFSTARQNAETALSFQLSAFSRQIEKYYEDLTRMGNALSVSLGEKTDAFLNEKGIDFAQVSNNEETIVSLQEAVFDKLGTELLKTHCSGAFVMFDATVNEAISNADKSKTGLYFQRASLDETDETLLLYRGIAELGREKGIMPHRKWRLEFDTEVFSGYKSFAARVAESPEDNTPMLSEMGELYGTSEKTMNFILPIIGKSGDVYGLCGFEVSGSYFKQYFAQTSKLEHLSCLFLPKNGDIINAEEGFSCGVYGGYYLPPSGRLSISDLGGGLVSLQGESAFVAKTKEGRIYGSEYLLLVAYPKQEYDAAVYKNIALASLLVLILVGATAGICVFFSKRFLRPVIKSIEQIRKQEFPNGSSSFEEIDDLFAFLDAQDKKHEEETKSLQEKCDEQDNLISKNQTDIQRLAYSRKNEISPDDYEMFKLGLKSLTKTEKRVFSLYIEGKSAEEIMETLNIQKGTLKYHNHNILNKLGVQSRKQMLRYATLLKQEAEA